MNRVEQAVERFNNGLNCSQAVFGSYSELFGLDSESAIKTATGFGGGMRAGATCGAVTGALMVLGLKHGNINEHEQDAKAKTYELVEQFIEKFKAKNKSVVCSDLLGVDFSTAQGRKTAQENGLFNTVCPQMVRDAAEILEEMLTKK
jgi:C_GCAxxG_C_C family probable redox protein